jgi:alkanesulfonate monooxygenase SsuD/methylene tetrahydromethanopterin reductase-like flavin-dependent oxidoreductase (luciferase family)
MNYGVNVPTSGGASEYSSLPFCGEIDWIDQRSYGVAVDELGYDSVAVPDHLMTGSGATTECLATITGLAGVTESVDLYPKTINNHLRPGPLLAKTVATVDAVSGGRVKLGMGAGWKRDEAVAYGYDWPAPPERLREMEETIELTKRLWTEAEVTYEGEFYDLQGATCRPHPVQDPHPPIMIGGGGEQFTLRIAAKHAATWNYYGSVDLMARKLDVLREHCERVGRPYEEIEKSWFARCVVRETDEEVEALLEEVPRFKPEHVGDDEDHLVGTPAEVCEQLRPYVDLGFEEFVVEFVDFPETTGLELFADEVVPNV